MKQTLLVVALFGFASCGRLDNKYIPANHQAASGNQQAYSGNAGASYAGNQQVYSGNSASAQYNGPIDQAANDVPVLRLDNNNDGESYNYALETGNGISAQEEGDARGDGTKAHGGFSYTAPDGQQVHIQYSAGEEGFQAQGSHIPTAPPVPAEILKAVEENLADEARGVYDDGQYREDGAGQYVENGAGQYRHEGVAQYNNAQNNAGQYNAGSAGYYKKVDSQQSSQSGYKY